MEADGPVLTSQKPGQWLSFVSAQGSWSRPAAQSGLSLDRSYH